MKKLLLIVSILLFLLPGAISQSEKEKEAVNKKKSTAVFAGLTLLWPLIEYYDYILPNNEMVRLFPSDDRSAFNFQSELFIPINKVPNAYIVAGGLMKIGDTYHYDRRVLNDGGSVRGGATIMEGGAYLGLGGLIGPDYFGVKIVGGLGYFYSKINYDIDGYNIPGIGDFTDYHSYSSSSIMGISSIGLYGRIGHFSFTPAFVFIAYGNNIDYGGINCGFNVSLGFDF